MANLDPNKKRTEATRKVLSLQQFLEGIQRHQDWHIQDFLD